MNSETSTLDNYIVLNTIGRGLFAKVKAVKCRSTEVIYAAKIYKHRISESYARNEASSISQIIGQNIISVEEINLNGIYRKKNHEEYSCIYIITEFCSNGDLFDLVYLLNPLSQETLRYFFLQILSSIESCHTSNICHRNIKLENYMVDNTLSLKLSDFGNSSRIESEFHTPFTATKYSAPETIGNNKYQGDKADIFSAGVILFVMHSLKFPFISINPIDIFYKKFITNPSLFWKQHLSGKNENFYSVEFMNLIELMLHPNPQCRGTLTQIKNHPWVRGPAISADDLRIEIENRRQIALNLARNQADIRMRVLNNVKGYKGESSSGSMSLSFDDLKVKNFVGVQSYKFSKITTGLDPNCLLGKLNEYITSIATECELSQEFYQLTAKVVTYEDPLELKITIFQKGQYYILDIDIIKGNNIDLADVIKDIKQLIFLDS